MKPNSIEEASEIIGSNPNLFVSGGRTKTAINASEKYFKLDMSSFSGILEYEPSEYTFTALAGTRLDEIDTMLAENDQFLPFDPPLIEHGSTIGGTISSGLSGPGQYRFGGIRDFVLGINFLNGKGKLIHSGGKVVKNAAGFDIPKLMVGSCGSFGAIFDVSMKVLPRPEKYVSIRSAFESIQEALIKLSELTASPFEFYCLDLKPLKPGIEIIVRLGGDPRLFTNRIQRLEQILANIRIIDGEDEVDYWHNEREFNWIGADSILVKIPVTPKLLPELDDFLARCDCERRYSVGANVAWVAWSQPVDSLDQFLNQKRLSGRAILGTTQRSMMGSGNTGSFYQRIKRALDPDGKWAEV